MLQNRVDPWGILCAVSDRGTLMGNRGILHSTDNRIVRPWAHRAWVTCLLSYGGIQRPKPFSAGNYSELFFLDEATAFAAGHRPCTFCQRARSLAFKKAWLDGNVPADQHPSFRLSAIDAQLHHERIGPDRSKRTYLAHVADLPEGTLFQHGNGAYLVAPDGFYQWSFQGYSRATTLPEDFGDLEVAVLTPASVVAAFSHGFRPHLHSTAAT